MLITRGLAKLGLRTYSTARLPYKGRIPAGGWFFEPLRKKDNLVYYHPMDDEIGYIRFLKEELPRSIIEDVPQNSIAPESILELMKYNVPLFPGCWSIITELIYRYVVPKEQQNSIGHKRARLIRSIFDVRYTGFAVIDDIMDLADSRKERPTWRMLCPSGDAGALCGGMFLLQLPYYVLQRHFKETPMYQRMVDTLMKGDFDAMIGNILDVYGQGGGKGKDIDPATIIAQYKAGTHLVMLVTFGMYHAGIDDPQLLKQGAAYQMTVGEMIQAWDDFCDYYCSVEQTGKPALDFTNGCTTWTSGTALQLFNEEQKQIFNENYGSPDLSKHEIVKKLYDDVNIPDAYMKFMKKRSKECYDIINQMDQPGLQAAFTNMLDYFVGDLYLQA